ncbi:Hypothetical_protein [Hexamita inflata]|uniref:Hypothetical_protein n=1 Tax=Hexamita inflata TaxID=28002 RepID=A0AA86RFP6_9EUKA|nr:Hypothetical protein HINF_LOCUS65329 [Hexamita inflata]
MQSYNGIIYFQIIQILKFIIADYASQKQLISIIRAGVKGVHVTNDIQFCYTKITDIYIYSEIDVEKPSANRFASLADSDIQFKRTDNYGKIFESPDRKTLKKPTRQRLKRSPRKQQKNATINWRTRLQRKYLTNPPRPKQSPTRKAMTRKFSLSKRRSPNCKVNLIQRRQ